MRLSVIAASLLVYFTPFPLVSHGSDIFVRLTPAEKSIEVGDPLFVRVSLFNTSKEGIVIDPRFESMYGTLQFEVRGEHETEFRMTHPPGQGGASPEVMQPRYFRPNRGLAAYQVLWRDDGALLFPTPGNYQIRAKVPIGDKTSDNGTTISVSEPVTITVGDAAAADQAIIAENFRKLTFILDPYQISAETDMAYLREITSKLGDGKLSETLQWLSFILQLGGESESEALAELAKIKERSGDVLSDVINYHMAYRYASLGKWAEVTKTLSSIEHVTERKLELFRELERKLGSDSETSNINETTD